MILFGTHGTTTLIFGDFSTSLLAMALQVDGSIVVAGFAYHGNQHFALARLTPDGTLGTSFGENGSLITEVGAEGDVAFGLAMQTDGKIIAAGYANLVFPGCCSSTRFAAVRYNPDGSLDQDFGQGGIATTTLGDYVEGLHRGTDVAHTVALQDDQRIVLAGQCRNSTRNDFCLLRYAADGSLAKTFGDGGRVFTRVGNPDFPNRFNSVVIQPGKKIVAVGAYGYTFTQSHFAIGRYNGDGSPDPTFNGGSLVVTPVSSATDEASAASLDGAGRIVVAGKTWNASSYDWAVARYEP